jgi:hypothetical protein
VVYQEDYPFRTSLLTFTCYLLLTLSSNSENVQKKTVEVEAVYIEIADGRQGDKCPDFFASLQRRIKAALVHRHEEDGSIYFILLKNKLQVKKRSSVSNFVIRMSI